jgi:hypothetical protein
MDTEISCYLVNGSFKKTCHTSNWGSIPGGGSGRSFVFVSASRTALGPTQPPIQCVQAALYPGMKLLGCEADNLPLSSARVKNAWRLTCNPLYI